MQVNDNFLNLLGNAYSEVPGNDTNSVNVNLKLNMQEEGQ